MVKLWALILLAGMVTAGLSATAGRSPAVSPLRGIIRSADGAPMEGVVVSARFDGVTTVTTSVYTDRAGAYQFPALAEPLKPGFYKVWAQAVGFEAGRADATLSAEKVVEQNFTLKPLADFAKQMSGIEWLASLPADTPEDRRIRRLVFVNCTQCHASGFPFQNRFDENGWRAIVNFMEHAGHTGAKAGRVNPFIRSNKEEIIQYLTKVRGPDSTFVPKPLPRLTGESNQIVVTEYDISPGHAPGYLVIQNGADWSKGTPSRVESSAAHDAIVDHEGYVWVADNMSPERTLAKLDPSTGLTKDYKFLDSKNVPVGPHDIIEDKAGLIWFNGPIGTISHFNPRTETFKNFPRPDSIPALSNGLIDLDSKGNVWAGVGARPVMKKDETLGIEYAVAGTDIPGGALKLDPKTGEYTFYRAVTPALRTYGVIVDADDNTYFTQPGTERLGVVDRKGNVGEIQFSKMEEDEFPYTQKDYADLRFEATDHHGQVWQKGPRRQAADKNGDTAWVTLSKGGSIAKIDIKTRKVTEYALPHRYSFPYHLAVDKNHMVWVSGLNTDRLFKFNPFAEQWTEYTLPTRGTDIRFVSVDNRTDPVTVWLAYYQTSKMARVQFRTSAIRQTTSR